MGTLTRHDLRRSCSIAAASFLTGSLFVGCSTDLSDIDAATDRLLLERTRTLGGDAIQPAPRPRPVVESRSGVVYTEQPPSRNPRTAELRFTPRNPAEEAADVQRRLDGYAQHPADVRTLSLQDAFRQGQETAREHLTAQEDYLLSAIRLLKERHLWDPRLFASTSAVATATGTNGSFVAPLNIINSLSVSQRLPYGGEVAAAWVWNATEQLRDSATGRYTQASSLVLSASQPLLRGAGMAAREDLIQAERELVYAARTYEEFRRSFLVSLARDYLSLAQQAAAIASQEQSLRLLQGLQVRTRALLEAGRIAQFEANIAESEVLRTIGTLASQRERYVLALERFKIRLGLPVDAPLAIQESTPALPLPEVTPDQATALALDYRLDLQTRRDRLDDARRSVDVAVNGLLPDANLSGAVTLRTKPGVREGGVVYEFDDAIYSAGITVNWPLDRRIERLELREATIRLERAQRSLEEFRDQVVVEARSRVREIDRARYALALAEKSVQINELRAREQEIKADEVTAQQVVDTANALLQARNARDQARSDLYNAVLDYLLATGQIRVERDGTLAPLPGLADAPTPAPATQPAPAAGDMQPVQPAPLAAPSNP